MRSRYIGFLLGSLPLCAMAQITLNQSANAPALGSEFNVHQQLVYVNPGPAGAGQNWNQSSLLGTSSFTVYVEDPMGVAGTHLIRGDVDSMYYNVTADGMFLVKEEATMTAPGLGSAPVSVNYDGEGVRVIAWPASFGTNWTGNVFGNYVLEGETFLRSGTVSGTVDGEGTVVMPTGPHDVVRIHTLVATNESGVLNGFNVSGNRRLHTWSFYADWLKHPLLKITADTLNITSPLPTSANSGRTEWLDELSVGVIEASENNATFGLWPTPATDVLNITLPEARAGTITANLYDLTGRSVRDWNISNVGNTTVDISGLPSGQYMVRLTGPSGDLGTRKVIVR